MHMFLRIESKSFKEKSVIHFQDPCEVMQIYVRALDMFLMLEVEESDTIKSVKDKIQDKEGVPVADQILVFHGKRLKYGRTIADYKIQND